MEGFRTDKRFETLYMGNQPRLVAYAQRFVDTREAALDIVQDAFIKIWEKYHTVGDEQARRLLFKMVRNSCLNYLKHQRITLLSVDSEANDPKGQELLYNHNFYYRSTEEDYLIKECDREIKSILSSLPEKCRQVFELRIYQGLKNKEIAEKLNISIKAVEKHVHRALTSFDDSVSSDSSVFFKMLVLFFLMNM